jgi:Ca2+-binding RTX toxin-like protein
VTLSGASGATITTASASGVIANDDAPACGAALLAEASGSQLLIGLVDNDTFIGGLGQDILTGGIGADTFRFLSIADSAVGAGRDLITGFSQAQGDLIDLSAIDANDIDPGRQAFTFVGRSAFTGSAGELRAAVSGSATIIQGSVAGGAAQFEIARSDALSLSDAAFRL